MRFEQFVAQQFSKANDAPELAHVRRIVATANWLAASEHARLEIVLLAAWFYDCERLPKDSSLYSTACEFAARTTGDYLRDLAYPSEPIPTIQHTIKAHSFSARVAPETREAIVVEDADCLDALDAIGIVRCLASGRAMGKALYGPVEPFPKRRTPDDTINIVNNFYLKLLRLTDTMILADRRAQARSRTDFMHKCLRQPGQETHAGCEPKERA